MAKRKLIPKSRITENDELDSLKRDRTRELGSNFDILLQALHCWDSLRTYREERARNKRYTYGDLVGIIQLFASSCSDRACDGDWACELADKYDPIFNFEEQDDESDA